MPTQSGSSAVFGFRVAAAEANRLVTKIQTQRIFMTEATITWGSWLYGEMPKTRISAVSRRPPPIASERMQFKASFGIFILDSIPLMPHNSTQNAGINKHDTIWAE